MLFSLECSLPDNNFKSDQQNLEYQYILHTVINILEVFSNPASISYCWFLCRLRSIATHRDHFVRRLSVCLSVRLSVRLSVTPQSYVSQATHAFLGMLPLYFRKSWTVFFYFFILWKCYFMLVHVGVTVLLDEQYVLLYFLKTNTVDTFCTISSVATRVLQLWRFTLRERGSLGGMNGMDGAPLGTVLTNSTWTIPSSCSARETVCIPSIVKK